MAIPTALSKSLEVESVKSVHFLERTHLLMLHGENTHRAQQ
jgi:hypothetical protein